MSSCAIVVSPCSELTDHIGPTRSPTGNCPVERLVTLPVGVKLAGGAEHRQELAEKGRREFDDLTQVSSANARRAVVCDQMDKGLRVRGIQARYLLSLGNPMSKGGHTLM